MSRWIADDMDLATADDRRVPNRIDAAGFWIRSRGLMLLRGLSETASPTRRFERADMLRDAPVVARLCTPLWTDADGEFTLTAGKVENLRIAVRAFDGVVVRAGAVLSFWRQLGRPSARRGFVPGREVREGCVVPTIGGGLCQLSNALATCAVRAGFELVERHAHTAAVPRDEADDRIDATVFWNYVDLRIRADSDWRIEARLDADDLIVELRAERDHRERSRARIEEAPVRAQRATPASRELRNCYGCEETQCFRHRGERIGETEGEAWLLDAWTPEIDAWLRAHRTRADAWIPLTSSMLRAVWRAVQPRTGFAALDAAHIERVTWAALRRIVWQRMCARRVGLRQRSIVDGQRWLAESMARRLSSRHVRLVVDQGLLPHLDRVGALAGRRFQVLATALPMREIERRLDAACADAVHRGAARATLADFRVDAKVATAEIDAMMRAERIVTAHADVARYWRQRGVAVTRVPWSSSAAPRAQRAALHDAPSSPIVVFPASALARKGAYVLEAALHGLHCRLRVLGARSDDRSLFEGLDVEYRSFGADAFADARVVALPAYVEHNPRALIAAQANGIAVIATPACGLEAGAGVTLIEAGDVAALREAIAAALVREPK